MSGTQRPFSPNTRHTDTPGHKHRLSVRKQLTASTACWRMDVNLENILFLDWTSFSREDLENSSIFFFLLLPPRSRLEVSYSDPCNERINVSRVRHRDTSPAAGPRRPGTKHCKQDVGGRSGHVCCSPRTRWHFPRQTPPPPPSSRGRSNTAHF